MTAERAKNVNKKSNGRNGMPGRRRTQAKERTKDTAVANRMSDKKASSNKHKKISSEKERPPNPSQVPQTETLGTLLQLWHAKLLP